MKKIVMIDSRKDIIEQCSGFPDWLQIIPPEVDLFEETCDFIKDLYLDDELAAVVLGDGPEYDSFLIDICDFIYNSKMEVKVILSTWNSEAAREFKAACPEIFYFPFNSGYLKFLEGFLMKAFNEEKGVESQKEAVFSTRGTSPMKFYVNADGGMDQDVVDPLHGPIGFVFSKEEAIGLKKFLNENF
jgi:hypothetical protein